MVLPWWTVQNYERIYRMFYNNVFDVNYLKKLLFLWQGKALRALECIVKRHLSAFSFENEVNTKTFLCTFYVCNFNIL